MSSTQRDVQMLSRLADQYRDRGMVSPRKNWADMLKAHTLYNACASRSSNKKWRDQAFKVQKTYWGDDLSSTLEEQTKITQGLKAQLYTIRDECRDDLSPVTDLINRLDCATENLDSADNREVTGQLVKGMEDLSLRANAKMKIFAWKVIDQSVSLHRKKAPCKFAAVALGSMAKGEATPYSDLEFMFLLEKKSPEIMEYFETLAMTVYSLIGNLQETKLKYMNVEELKTFKDKGKSGFKIDGLQSKAGNIPTGNGTAEQRNKFILTVDELLDKYQHIFLNPDPEESKKGDFTSMLAYTTVIYGEHRLLTDFEKRKKNVAVNEVRIRSHNTMIKQDVEDYDFLPLVKLYSANHSANLKSALYRFPSILIHNLKIIFDLESKTSWKTLDKLHQMKKLSQSFYASLQFLLASALYIRMAAYLHHDSQNDDITFVPASNPQSKDQFWHMPKQLYLHMSLHMIPLKQTIGKSTDPLSAVTTEIVYDTNVLSAHVNFYAGNHEKALKVLEALPVKGYCELDMLVDCYQALQHWDKLQSAVHSIICFIRERPDNLHLTRMLRYFKFISANGCYQAGDLQSAKKGFDNVLSDLPSHLSYNHVIYAQASNFYLSISEETKSKLYYGKATVHLTGIAHTISQSLYDRAMIGMLLNRANALIDKLQFMEAKPLALQSIQLLKNMYGSNAISYDLAHSYFTLGSIYGGRGQQEKSLDYLRKSGSFS